jgi:hypothetical protein
MEHILYTYAIARPHVGREPDELPGHTIWPGADVEALDYGSFLVIVSRVPSDIFASQLEEHLQNPDWLRARAVAHQQVLAELIEGYTVLPLRFCTLYRDETQMADVLGRYAPRLQGALDRLAGATEWGLKVFCDRPVLTTWAMQYAPDLAKLREQAERAPQGSAYLLRKKLEQSAGNSADRMISLCMQSTHQVLAGLARAAISNEPQSSDMHGRQLEMIHNAAFFVAEERFEAFREALAHLEDQYAGRGFSFELTGPWPAYNFANLPSEPVAEVA